MRRAIGQSLRVGISAHAVCLLQVSRWRGNGMPVTLLAEHAIAASSAHPFDAIASALRALLQEQQQVQSLAGWPAALVLADDLVRLWRVTPPPGANRIDDLEAAAGLRFQSLYGEAPSAWQIGADWNAVQPFFAAAVPRALLASLTMVAEQFRLAVVGVEPHFVSSWNRWHGALKPGAWYALVHDGLMTLAPIADDGVRALRVLPIPAAPGVDQAWLTHTLQREALLLDLPAPALLQACGAVPASWLRTAGAASAAGTAAAAATIGCEALDHARQSLGAGLSPVVQLAWGGAR